MDWKFYLFMFSMILLFLHVPIVVVFRDIIIPFFKKLFKR